MAKKHNNYYVPDQAMYILLVCWRMFWCLRATLDQGPRSRHQWIQAILLVESFKLVPRPLDEGSRPKSGKLGLNLHGTCFGGKINWFGPKKLVLEGELLIWRTKGPRYSPTQGFNLLKICSYSLIVLRMCLRSLIKDPLDAVAAQTWTLQKLRVWPIYS
jgi:hypothetical protein